MRILFFCFVLILFLACGPKKPVSVKGIAIPPELMEAAGAQNFDYTGQLAKSLQSDGKALHELLGFSQKTDTAATAAHGKVLRSVLEAVGDGFFAKSIAEEPAETQRRVWAILDAIPSPPAPADVLKISAPMTYQALFPKTEASAREGLYCPSEKVNTFLDCGSPGARFVAIDETGNIGTDYKKLIPYPYSGQCVYAGAKGFTSAYFGAKVLPDNYDGFFIITEITELKAKNFRNTCIPYDLWAIGNEPNWQAQISEAEGIIEFQRMGDERATVFSYVKPTVEDSTTVYAAINDGTGDNIRITVLPEPCNDAMSDRKYSARVELRVNGESFMGCGVFFNTASEPKEH